MVWRSTAAGDAAGGPAGLGGGKGIAETRMVREEIAHILSECSAQKGARLFIHSLLMGLRANCSQKSSSHRPHPHDNTLLRFKRLSLAYAWKEEASFVDVCWVNGHAAAMGHHCMGLAVSRRGDQNTRGGGLRSVL